MMFPIEFLRVVLAPPSCAYGSSALLALFSSAEVIELRLLPLFSLSSIRPLLFPLSSPRALSSALLGSGGTGGMSVDSGLSDEFLRPNRWKGCSPRGSVALSWRVIPLR